MSGPDDLMPWEVASVGAPAELASGISSVLPHLESERCQIRPPQISDFAYYREILMSDRVNGLGAEPFTREGAWLDFSQAVACWQLRGFGPLTVEDKNGNVLGFVLLQMEFGDHEPELGYVFRESAEGKGIAFEACTVVRDFALKTLKMPRLVSYIDPDNERSIRLAKRLGALRDKSAEAKFDEPVKVYRHDMAGTH